MTRRVIRAGVTVMVTIAVIAYAAIGILAEDEEWPEW